MGESGRPSGVVTFLFTDIEGSTRRWEADPEAMRRSLSAHDDVLGSVIESRGGWVFKHTGDGVCAAFGSPRAAVDAAVDAQRALELPVRMGVATGEAERRGDDYFGPALNRAARVMAAGHGGQVLVAQSTAVLARGVELAAMGSRRLRDLSAPVELFQVVAPGLRSEFPPLRTLDTTPGNLKAQTSSFLGRDRELLEVCEAVRAHRVVTLTGVGGVGKTRLALQAAAEMAPEYVDGVFVAELAAVGDPAAVPDAVASVLGVMQQPCRTVGESVATALEERERLLVLDNCEHVLDAVADLVETVLDHSATARILATSREGLRVRDELVWTVPSLSVREGAESDGVALFAERARALVRDFSLDSKNDVDAVAEICRRLDGIPLAIELAASRIVSMSPVDLRDRLDDRFRLLSGSRRAVERHQTLRQAVQWSYDLLEDAEQAVLRRCAVFAGRFDLSAAVAVAADGDHDEYGTLDVLDALARKSLLVVDRSTPGAQYAMLETIRQFADEQLVEAGEALSKRNAHEAYYRQRLVEAVGRWDGPDQLASFDWLHSNMTNLRAAFGWAADNHDLDAAATIVTRTSFLGTYLELHEPSSWAVRILPEVRAARHRQLPGVLGTHAYGGLAGDVPDAIAAAEETLDLLNDPRYEREPFHHPFRSAMTALMFSGLLERAVQAERTYREVEPSYADEAGSTIALAALGRTQEASERVATLPWSTGTPPSANPYYELDALIATVFVLRDTDPARALTIARKATARARETKNKMTETYCSDLLIQLEAQCGEPMAALEAASLAIERHYDAGNNEALRNALGILAVPLERVGHHHVAASLTGYAAEGRSAQTVWPEINATAARLREALGDDQYESLAVEGAAMTRSTIVQHAVQAIDDARSELLR